MLSVEYTRIVFKKKRLNKNNEKKIDDHENQGGGVKYEGEKELKK